jgi:hypothetical protein
MAEESLFSQGQEQDRVAYFVKCRDFENYLKVRYDLTNGHLKLMGIDESRKVRPVTLPIVGNGEEIIILGKHDSPQKGSTS